MHSSSAEWTPVTLSCMEIQRTWFVVCIVSITCRLMSGLRLYEHITPSLHFLTRWTVYFHCSAHLLKIATMTFNVYAAICPAYLRDIYRPVASTGAPTTAGFVLQNTMSWSSTGPTPSDTDLGVSVSPPRPSGTNFRRTSELLTQSRTIHTRVVCACLLVEGASVNIRAHCSAPAHQIFGPLCFRSAPVPMF